MCDYMQMGADAGPDNKDFLIAEASVKDVWDSWQNCLYRHESLWFARSFFASLANLIMQVIVIEM